MLAYLIELLLKLWCVVIYVIDIDDDVSSCCVPTIKYLQNSSSSDITAACGEFSRVRQVIIIIIIITSIF